ncbi:MAG: zinc ribbon domain-containing protein [Firmicutes bacterium]|nr:zinc ribbon domain-containing protein [Bacillota bacterium]
MESAIVLLIIKVVMAGGVMFYLYKDARARDHSWFMWTFAPIIAIFTPDFVGSVLAVLFIFILYTMTKPKGELVKCPHCAKKIHDILAFCPFCRQSVKRECLRCHDTVDWHADRCPHCGSMSLTKF